LKIVAIRRLLHRSMVTRAAAGQEKHAAQLISAQKLDLLTCKPPRAVCLRSERENAISPRMCFHATISGAILPVWSKTAYDEVMLHCARIGFKP
jgi:hypothetical protein